MAIGFYFDEHMRRVVAKALAERGIEVLMAIDVGMVEKDDDTEHLPYATERNLIVVTFDRPFAGRTMSHDNHAGLICLSEDFRNNIGGQINVLNEFAETHEADQVKGQVFWIK